MKLDRYVYKQPSSSPVGLYYGIRTGERYQEKLAYPPNYGYPTDPNAEYMGDDPEQWIMKNRFGMEDEPETDLYVGIPTWRNSANSTPLAEIWISVPPWNGEAEVEFTYTISRGRSVNVQFERKYDRVRGIEYGLFIAKERSGKELWRYTAGGHQATELWGFGAIGIANGVYYLYDDDVIALDLQTGEEIWRCPFGRGNASFDFDDAGTLYICGYYGPDLVAIDKNGEQLNRIDRFDADYHMADQVECQEDKVIVRLSSGPDGYKEKGYPCVVYLPDYHYEILPSDAERAEEAPG